MALKKKRNESAADKNPRTTSANPEDGPQSTDPRIGPAVAAAVPKGTSDAEPHDHSAVTSGSRRIPTRIGMAIIFVEFFAILTVWLQTDMFGMNSESREEPFPLSQSDSRTSATMDSLDVKGAPTVIDTTPASVSLEWERVDAAVSYVVKYSTWSVAASDDPNAVHDNDVSVAWTTAVIEGLRKDATYYFAVVAVDKDGNESEHLSEETQVNLQKANRK